MGGGPALAALLRGAAFLLAWIVLAGPEASGLPVGLAAAALATWASLRLMPPARCRVRPVALASLLVRLPWEALKAGAAVARIALDPGRRPQPGVIAWTPLLPPGPARDAFLAYASLLPGTLPAGELPDGRIAIHAILADDGIAAATSAEEARFARAFGADA